MARILVIDDSAIMRRNLTAILRELGHEVVGEACNGFQALMEYNALCPDVVTMDITMPISDGIEATRKILTKHPKALIIMISALNQKERVFEALKAGAKHYIVKPFTYEKVNEVLNTVLRQYSPEAFAATAGLHAVPPPSRLSPSTTPVSSSLSKPPSPSEPFTVLNQDGLFIIQIHNHLNNINLISLQNAVQGFLFIKPLRVIFDYGDQSNYSGDVLRLITELMQQITSAQGSTVLAVKNPVFLQLVVSKHPGLNIKSYKFSDDLIHIL